MKNKFLLTLLAFPIISFAQTNSCVTVRASCDINPTSSTCVKSICGKEKAEQYDQQFLNMWIQKINLIGQEINDPNIFISDIKNNLPEQLKNFVIRVVKENQPITQEINYQRITVKLNSKNLISSITIN